MDKSPKLKDTTECVKARDVLWYLAFTGFAVNYMIRINLNIALVSMLKPSNSTKSITSECIVKENNFNLSRVSNINHVIEVTTDLYEHTTLSKNETDSTKKLTKILLNLESPSYTTTAPKKPITSHLLGLSDLTEDSDKFSWDQKQQGKILGSFFWLHWVTQIPGGILSAKYGTKLLFGLSNFSATLCCFFIPWFASLGVNYLIFIRLFQGLVAGFAWPSMHTMTARWIPPNERSQFITAYLGSSVGVALTYPLLGFIIDLWGWKSAFYVCGCLGTAWFSAWWLLVYDSPAEHPRITEDEKEYIIHSLGQSVSKKKAPVPWVKIMTSIPVLLTVVSQFGSIWGFFTLMTHAPIYFKNIHGMNMKATGILSGMPHIFRMLWAYIISQLGDYLLRTNKASRTNVRKLATSICTIVQGIFMLGLAYSGCNFTLAIVFLTISVAMNGAVSTGPLAGIVDISPNYAGVILGIQNSAVAMVGFLTPTLVGYLTYNNETAVQYQKVFWVATIMLFSTGTLYLLFSKSELQAWNSPEEVTNEKAERELMIIQSKTNNEDTPKEDEKTTL